nr:hypothetical protein BdHM001_08140 [Bdellovibrio sp. HM001]
MRIQIVALLTSIIGVSFLNSEALAGSMTCNRKQSATNCMVCNCYHESRGESFDGMVAVTKVVLSRMEADSHPDSACGVVYEDSQFSWTQDKYSNNINPSREEDIEGLEQCKKAVSLAVSEGPNDIIYYYNPDVARPYWARHMTSCGTIGNHRFLVPRGESCPKKLGANGKTSQKKSSGGSSKTSTGVR